MAAALMQGRRREWKNLVENVSLEGEKNKKKKPKEGDVARRRRRNR